MLHATATRKLHSQRGYPASREAAPRRHYCHLPYLSLRRSYQSSVDGSRSTDNTPSAARVRGVPSFLTPRLHPARAQRLFVSREPVEPGSREQVVMGSTWTEEQARATLKPFLLEANLELMTSKVAKKHMEEKLGVKVSKGDESKAFAKLCLSITTEILKKRKAAAALPPDSSEDEARPADSSEDEKAKKPAPAKKKSKPASPVAADERPEWVRPTKGPRDTDDSEVSDDEPPAKPVATKKARQASEKKARPRATKAKKTARAGDSSDEDDSSGSEIISGDEAVMGAGGAAGALYVPLAKQRAPRATTSRFAEGRPTKKAMQP